MRADRLVSVLLILQARGRITAKELAEELEISERTARRDLEALSMAGVPVYSQQGRGGGWSLVGGARTDLSGLTADETRALFMVAGPGAATPQVKSALRKLVRALPEPFRVSAETAAGAVLVDQTRWDQPAPRPPEHLDVLQQATVEGRQVRLGYRDRDGKDSERTVHPLGLVSKGPVWYLVADTDAGLRTFRLNRVRSVEVTDELAQRPEDFDLEETWRATMAVVDERRRPASATVWADPDAVPVLRSVFGTRVALTGTTDDAGNRVELEVREASVYLIAVQLAGFGDRVEVTAPDEVRRELARIGRELTGSYKEQPVR
jgi:predicted DNA-binding transcriptional regulator YafY